MAELQPKEGLEVYGSFREVGFRVQDLGFRVTEGGVMHGVTYQDVQGHGGNRDLNSRDIEVEYSMGGERVVRGSKREKKGVPNTLRLDSLGKLWYRVPQVDLKMSLVII